MGFGSILSVLFIAIFSITLTSNSSVMVDMLLMNAGVQLLLFIFVAVIPFLKTGRMSFVDIAWPFGVALIGTHILLFAEGDVIKRTIVGGIYLFIGLRMGIGALVMGKTTGVIFKTEFPRYQYRKEVFKQQGIKNSKAHIVAEIMAQGFANMSVLALPGFIIANNLSEGITAFEIAGLLIWACAYLFESVADGQKLLFISKNKDAVCNVGLWRYSRHPNYFAEWLVWTGLVVGTIPSWLALHSSENTFVWLTLGIGSLCASLMLYITLVYLTGAKPSEYYSVKKRAGYKAYQQQTNMFFPWFVKK